MTLAAYRAKRNFSRTPEPRGARAAPAAKLRFFIQKHAATRLHYDLRLEMDGVLKSWAVPNGPSLDPDVRTLAVAVEDHPLEYGTFEGVIPQGEYGGGTVMLWDRGIWQPDGDPGRGYKQGKLRFHLHGEKLHGGWTLVRMSGGEHEKKNWLLIKRRDKAARPSSLSDITASLPLSVATGRDLSEIAEAADAVWSSERQHDAPPTARWHVEELTARSPKRPTQFGRASGNTTPRQLRAGMSRS